MKCSTRRTGRDQAANRADGCRAGGPAHDRLRFRRERSHTEPAYGRPVHLRSVAMANERTPRRLRLRLSAGALRPSAAVAATLAGAALLAAAMVAGLPGSAPAAVACRVDYSVNQWATGFTAQLQVTNNTAAVTGWTLTWTFGGD